MGMTPGGAGLSMLGLGGLCLARAVHSFKVARQVASWPTTTGRILSSRLDEYDHRVVIPKLPAFLYAYDVEGKRYTSHTVWPGEPTFSDPMPGDMDHIWSDYYEGRDVIVHYDPDSPHYSYLELRRNRTLAAFTGLGVFLLAFGVFMLAVGWQGSPLLPRGWHW